MNRRTRFRIAAAGLLLALGAALVLWIGRPRLSEEAVRTGILTTIQREAPASFYVTGTLDLTVTTTVENTKVLLPDVLDLSLGTTRATVRMPGRVSYGFDVRDLRPEHIQVRDDGVVQVTLPALGIHAVEPELAQMEVQTSVGWARLYRSSGQRVERAAIRSVQEAFEAQAAAHLRDAAQPRVNTARALRLLLTPVLEAAGMPAPRFRFQIGPTLVMEEPE